MVPPNAPGGTYIFSSPSNSARRRGDATERRPRFRATPRDATSRRPDTSPDAKDAAVARSVVVPVVTMRPPTTRVVRERVAAALADANATGAFTAHDIERGRVRARVDRVARGR